MTYWASFYFILRFLKQDGRWSLRMLEISIAHARIIVGAVFKFYIIFFALSVKIMSESKAEVVTVKKKRKFQETWTRESQFS